MSNVVVVDTTPTTVVVNEATSPITVSVTQSTQTLTIEQTTTQVVTATTAGPQGPAGPAGASDHLLLSNIGTNTHAQIDTALTGLANTSGTNTGDQDLSGLVPYTGATGDVDLGAFKLDAQSFLINSVIPIKTLGNNNEIAIGVNAGSGVTTGSGSSMFFGAGAGQGATGASSSNFFGNSAGLFASGAGSSNFFGAFAGGFASGASGANFFGAAAGSSASNAASSNFFGNFAGQGASNAASSNFLGPNAGKMAVNAKNSIFIGADVGVSDSVNNTTAGYWSIAIGPYSGTGGFSNSIAIGRGVINSATTQMNFGNVLYGTGIYNSDTKTASPIAGGKIGIGVNAPTATLDVNGDLKLGASGTIFQKLLSATATLNFPSIGSNSTAALTMTVTGATVGASVHVGAPSGFEAGLVAFGFVSATNTVTIRVHNASGGSLDPASATWRATVINF